jgi:ubiquinone/menaquinone biosynthesis C-methylase UbiE
MSSHTGTQQRAIEAYDSVFLNDQVRKFYGDTDYMNFGFWEPHIRTQKEACDNLMAKLLAMLSHREGTILDVACGMGETTCYLSKTFAPEDITGINISANQIEGARRKNPRCRFFVMDAVHLAFPDESMDHVISVEAAFHFDTREAFLREARRVLKPGGRIVLSDQLIPAPSSTYPTDFVPPANCGDESAYRDTFARCGLKILEFQDQTEACWKQHFLHILAYSHRLYIDGDLDEAVLRRIADRNYVRAQRHVEEGRIYALVCAEKPR